MLTLVGIGVGGARAMGADAREAIASARTVYMERFTSPVPDGDVEEVRRAAEAGGAAFRLVARWAVEDGGEILRNAAAGDVALVCYGDPYVATTHIELRARAEAAGTPTRSVHGASALTSIVGECGLHQYKVGRTATVTRAEASTPYGVLCENIDRGCHTVLLLEYDEEGGAFMPPRDALAALLAVEGERRALALTRETFAAIASRVGRADQRIVAGSVDHLMGADVGEPPHSIVVPGSLHFTEADALRALAICEGEPRANSETARREAHRMVARYVPMVGAAIREARLRGADARVLDCAGDYAADAEEFLRRGREGLAILSIGYADGLVDALRIGAGLGREGAPDPPGGHPAGGARGDPARRRAGERLKEGMGAGPAMSPQETAALRAAYVAGLTGGVPRAGGAELEALARGGLLDHARGTLTRRGRAELRVVLSGGVFDIIHPGHIHTLRAARALGDVLVVVVATDATAVKMKRRRPLHAESQRRDLVTSLRMVDACVVGDEEDMFRTVSRIGPDVIALGYDQAHQEGRVREGCARVGSGAEVVRLGSADPEMSSGEIERAYGTTIHGI